MIDTAYSADTDVLFRKLALTIFSCSHRIWSAGLIFNFPSGPPFSNQSLEKRKLYLNSISSSPLDDHKMALALSVSAAPISVGAETNTVINWFAAGMRRSGVHSTSPNSRIRSA